MNHIIPSPESFKTSFNLKKSCFASNILFIAKKALKEDYSKVEEHLDVFKEKLQHLVGGSVEIEKGFVNFDAELILDS